MKLKALKEKRNALLNDLEVMVSGLEVEGEVRALTVEEREAFDSKKAEIESIEETISRIEETRAKDSGEDAVKELAEKRSNEDMEKRVSENFFRGNDLNREERMILTSQNNNTALMPVEIQKTIMQKLEEQCPILERAKRFSSKGTLRLIREDSYGSAGITAENTGFKDTDVTFKNIELRAFKVTAMVQATFEMLQNVEVDLTNYLMDVIVRRLSRELNRLFLVGTGENQPKGLTKEGIEVHVNKDGLEIGDFINMQTAIHPDYLNGACWIMGRKVFSQVANLLDGNGRPYLTNHVMNEKIQYMFLGLPVIVDNNMAENDVDTIPVIMANIGEAYAINVLTDISVKHLTETGFTSGYEVFAGYVMVDGRVVNADAVVIGKGKDMAARTRSAK